MNGAPRKWRPSLALVTAAMIALVLTVAVTGFAIVRFNVNQPPGVELLTALVLALLAATAVGFVFVRAILRPVRELVTRADRIARGDTGAIGPLAHHGTRELAHLSDGFMDMAQSLSNRSAQIRTYARHVTHELKTPLTSLRGAAELMADNPDMASDQRQRFLTNMIADVSRMSALLDKLNEQARAETPTQASTRFADALAALRAKTPSLKITITGDAEITLPLSADTLLLVLSHLADNAAAHGARALDIAISADDAACRLVVQDDGAGVAAGDRDRIFDPFFTTRRAEGGTGMGLTIVRAMLEAHGGGITMEDSPCGARFAVILARA